jgi:hypothetical protein
MANAIIKAGKIELHRFKGKHVFPLFHNMSDQNLNEFKELYRRDILEELLDSLSDDLCHVIEIEGVPIAICGVRDQVLWTMFTKDIRKHWRSFVKESPRLIQFYHVFYDELYCNVWDQNVFIHNWLVHLGFEPIGLTEGRHTVVNFVRCNSLANDIDSEESRPVMH